MNLEYKPKSLEDKLKRLQNAIDCVQQKDSENKVVILQYEEHKGNPKQLFAIGIKDKIKTSIKTDYHEYNVINIYLWGFLHGKKCTKEIKLH